MKAANGEYSFTLGINEYSDLSTEEWRHYLLGTDVHVQEDQLSVDDEHDDKLPTSVDWREKVRTFINRL